MIERYSRPEMSSVWSEENKFNTWLKVEIAACEAWNELGKIPSSALTKIKKQAGFSVARINAIEKTVNHDVIAFLTAVAEKVGPDSRFIHMGMTSSDVLDTAFALQLKEAGEKIVVALKEFINALKLQAISFKDQVMIGRSHGVHAEPMTLGLKFALWYVEMQRNLERMEKAIENISVGKFSGAVGTYSNIDPKVEKIACKKLGLKPVLVASQIIQRDRHGEYLTTLALIAATIEKIALEIRGLQKTEIGEVEEPFRKGQKGSSAMPHKKNPIICERMCGLARIIRANAMVAFENIALWHERDISHSSSERIIFPDSTVLVDYMLAKMQEVLKDLVIYPDNMRRNLEKSGGIIFSQKLMLALVDKGLTREEAYKLAQTAAMRARVSGRTFKEEVLEEEGILAKLSAKEIEAVFDLGQYLKNIGHIYKNLGLEEKNG